VRSAIWGGFVCFVELQCNTFFCITLGTRLVLQEEVSRKDLVEEGVVNSAQYWIIKTRSD
jgi:hypothetical protein